MLPKDPSPLNEEEKKPTQEKKAAEEINPANSTDSSTLNKPNLQFFNYLNAGTRDILAYAMLVIGVLLLFFHPIIGEFLIGVVAGAYFCTEINKMIKNYQNVVEQQGLVRSLILGGILLAFLVAAPGIFIGIAFIMVLKTFISLDDKPAA